MRKSKGKNSIVLYIILISIIISLFLIKYFSNKYSKIFYSYGEAEARRIITLVINKSMSKEMFNEVGVSELLKINRNSNGSIENIDMDTYREAIILDTITNKIEKNINAMEKGDIDSLDIDLRGVSDIDYDRIKDGIVYYIPFGSLTGSGFISNIGPYIPIKLILIGDVIAKLDSNIFEYGINNAMIEVDVNVSVTMLVSFAFISRRIEVKSSRPIIMKIIQGEIPDYYLGNSNLHS